MRCCTNLNISKIYFSREYISRIVRIFCFSVDRSLFKPIGGGRKTKINTMITTHFPKSCQYNKIHFKRGLHRGERKEIVTQNKG